jgi:hypothetical protein
MPQSSTARWEATGPAPTPISINSNGDANPKNANILNNGSVTFNASKPFWLYFSPIGVFGDSQGILKLVQGNNGPFDPGRPDVTVTYCTTAPNTTCTPLSVSASEKGSVNLPLGGGNTIKVG